MPGRLLGLIDYKHCSFRSRRYFLIGPKADVIDVNYIYTQLIDHDDILTSSGNQNLCIDEGRRDEPTKTDIPQTRD